MKTAMHELFDELGVNFKGLDKEYYLALEKQQIYDAFVSGDNRGKKEIPFNCEQYYNQTYKKDKS